MSDRKLQVVPLGGLGEFGMNSMALRYGDDIIVIDAGMMFPEDELLGVVRAAQEAGVMAHLCVDAGRTEFHGVPTPTCCAVGPDFPDRIDPITGHLKLL